MSNVSEQLVCPITHTIISDPVIADDGYTYEKSAIITWITQKGTSPITRDPISISSLKPNRLIKDMIDQYSNPGLAILSRQAATLIATSTISSSDTNTNVFEYI
jgi:hypothetical protein